MRTNAVNDVISARRLKLFLVFSLVGLASLALLLPDTAFAASFSGTAESGVSWDLSKYKDMMGSVYRIAMYILFPVAAVSLAAAAFMMITGDEQSVAKGKKQAFITLFTVAALLLLPAVLDFGVSTGSSHGWKPTMQSAEDFKKANLPDFTADKGEGGKTSKTGGKKAQALKKRMGIKKIKAQEG
ncbi:hypothetical protein ACKQTC_07105 [Peptococcus simiae]|uniref:TrbC/VIRB2 family protein n=1 Tax=Peptococcus simiae TaxID=1643805 RepID=A0ABW9GZU5_9FIRM